MIAKVALFVPVVMFFLANPGQAASLRPDKVICSEKEHHGRHTNFAFVKFTRFHDKPALEIRVSNVAAGYALITEIPQKEQFQRLTVTVEAASQKGSYPVPTTFEVRYIPPGSWTARLVSKTYKLKDKLHQTLELTPQNLGIPLNSRLSWVSIKIDQLLYANVNRLYIFSIALDGDAVKFEYGAPEQKCSHQPPGRS